MISFLCLIHVEVVLSLVYFNAFASVVLSLVAASSVYVIVMSIRDINHSLRGIGRYDRVLITKESWVGT